MAALTVRRFLRPETTLPKAQRIQLIGPGARARDPQGAS
jgi:hypothetical protein